MQHTIPPAAINCLDGQHEAAQIAESASIAYWMHGRDDGTCAYHLNIVHAKLAELAKALGYTITPIAAPRVVTERDQLGANIWRAWDDRLGADTSPYGYGATETEAVEDLKRQIEEAA